MASLIAPKLRNFKAARHSRLESDWIINSFKTNEELKKDLEKLVLRSRDLAKNHSDYIKYLDMRETNIVGENGIKLNMKVKDFDGNIDATANNIIEDHFKQWGKKRNGYCTLDRNMDWVEIQAFVDRSFATDGECFVRVIKGADNPYLFSLQFIDSLDIDISLNCEANYSSNKNRIIMGIELDDFDRPVAYYRKIFSNNSQTTCYQHERILAEQIIHVFKMKFAAQVRGYPASTGAILDLNMVDGYKETALVGARVAAAQMGIWVPDKSAIGDAGLDLDGNVDDNNEAPPEVDVTPGKIIRGKKGWTLETFTPTQPVAGFSPFVKTVYRSIANGLNVNYNTFRNDLESVNYSSLRAGTLAERDRWKMEQKFLISSFNEVLFAQWLQMFLATNLSPLPLRKYYHFLTDNWQPRRWVWVDPIKDAKANQLKLEMDLTSKQRLCAELGIDYYDIIDELKTELEVEKSLQLTPNLIGKEPTENSNSENKENNNENQNKK